MMSVGNVRALHRVVVPIDVVLAAELVAARLGDELALHAGVRHLGALAGGAHEHFLERGVVEVEAGAVGALGGVDALDQHAHLAGEAVGGVAGLRAGAVAADVDARHLHRRRHRQQRPHVAAVRNRVQLLELEVLLHARRGRVDDRRRAGHRDRLLQRGERELDVQVGGEAQRDLHAFTLEGIEAGELVAHRIGARGDGGKAVVTGFRGHRRLRAQRRRAGRRHRHTRQDRALRIRHTTLDGAGRAGASTLGKRRRCRSAASATGRARPS